MKTLLAGVALSVVLVAPRLALAQSQAVEKSGWVGPRLGLDMAQLGGDDVNDAAVKNRVGLWAGGFALLQLGPNFALEPAIGYAQKGMAVKNDPGGGTLKLDYISVPVMAVGLIPVAPTARLRGLAGPSVSYLVSAKAKENGQTADVKDNLKSIDVGLVFGAGVDVALPSGLLVFDLRYELGLTSIDDSDNQADIKNRVFSINAGYGF